MVTHTRELWLDFHDSVIVAFIINSNQLSLLMKCIMHLTQACRMLFLGFLFWGLSSHSRHMETSPLPVKGCTFWPKNYARHSWPLSCEGSLACQTHWDTGHPFVMVISEDPWHSDLMPSVWQWSCHYLFLRHRSVATGIRIPNLPHAR